MNEFEVRTTAHTEFVEITDRVQRLVGESGVKDGVCTVLVPHTTASVNLRSLKKSPAKIGAFRSVVFGFGCKPDRKVGKTGELIREKNRHVGPNKTTATACFACLEDQAATKSTCR